LENPQSAIRIPKSAPGLWSELRFRLRRPLGTLTGTIDKLLITPAKNGIDVEIIDFKTNRFPRSGRKEFSLGPQAESGLGGEIGAPVNQPPRPSSRAGRGAPAQTIAGQTAFDFDVAPFEDVPASSLALADDSLDSQIESAARDYRLQMQAYALAFRELLPSDVRINSLRVTLHFIQPNVEKTLAAELLGEEACARAVDEAMAKLVSLDGTIDAEDFPTITSSHCRTCSFLDFCSPGQEWVRLHTRQFSSLRV
jgi:hypothetical protein